VGLAAPAAVLLVVYAPAMLLLAVLAIRLDGLGLPILGAMGLFAALAAGLFLPLARLPVAGVAALLGVALIAVGALRLDYSERHPRPDFLSYVYDADRGRAAWEAGDRDSWSRPLLARARAADVELSPFATVAGWRAPAPVVPLAAPRLEPSGRASAGDFTVLRLRLASRRGADAAAVRMRADRLIAARVEGRPVPVDAGELRLPYVGLPAAGVELVLRLRGHGALRATVRDYTQGLPRELNVPPRPPDTMPAALSLRADPTVVVASTVLRY
jgi:hypothetical protein